MPLHPLIERILTTGESELPDRTFVRCRLVHPAWRVRARLSRGRSRERSYAMEVGMAYGVSTLCIADAQRALSDAPSLVSIDPCQTMDWRSAGLHLLERAGLSQSVRLIEQPIAARSSGAGDHG